MPVLHRKKAELFRVTKLLETDNTIFDLWKADTNARQIPVLITQTARTKYELSFPERFMDGASSYHLYHTAS